MQNEETHAGTSAARGPKGAESIGGTMRWLSAHAWARRGLSSFAGVLGVVAFGTLCYPFATNIYQSRLQHDLSGELRASSTKTKFIAHTFSDGDAVTRLRIAKTDVDVVVVEGTGPSALRAGAGHYPATPLPGQMGNVAIAGHRTTYGHPFHDNDHLALGDLIELDTPVGSYTYKVIMPPYAVPNSDWSPILNTPGRAMLTLTTCHPKGSAAQRLVVKAELVKTVVAK